MARSRRTRVLQTSEASRGGPVYVFAADEPLRIMGAKNANPQLIGESLARIAEANNGHLTPVATVDAARDPTHALHRHFLWDDQSAAEGFRQEQARHLIRSIRIIDDNREANPRAFLSIADQASGGVSYRTLGEVVGNVQLQRAVLERAERDLQAFEKRFQQLSDVCALVREARELVTQRRASVGEGAHVQ